MPILKVYDDTKVFWNEVAPHLKKEEAKNSLGLGLSYGFQTNPQDCLYQSALFEGDKFLGTLICSRYYNNHNLLPSPITKSEHAQILFDKFKETKISVSNLIGELETARYIDDVDIWLKSIDQRNLSSHTYKEDIAELVYNFACQFLPYLKKLLKKLDTK